MSAPTGDLAALLLDCLRERPMTTRELQRVAMHLGSTTTTAALLARLERLGALRSVRVTPWAGGPYPALWAVTPR